VGKGAAPCVDADTFRLVLYVLVDDFCKTHPAPEGRGPGLAPARPTRHVASGS